MKQRFHHWLTGSHHLWVGLLAIWLSLIVTVLFALGWVGEDRFVFVCLVAGFLYGLNLWIWRTELKAFDETNQEEKD